MKRLSVSGLFVLVAIGLWVSPAFAQAPQAMDGDRLKAMWNELTPAERASYEALLTSQSAKLPTVNTRGPVSGDTCTGPDVATVALPYMTSNNTTGLANDYDLDNTAANGDCGSGQTTFAGTGGAPDLTYSIQVDTNCTLQVTATPTAPNWDLALMAVQGSCTSLPGFINSQCIALDDNGGSGTAETVTINAVAGTTYFVIIDGFNTAVGPFNLSITEVGATGCSLVPVELTSFSVD